MSWVFINDTTFWICKTHLWRHMTDTHEEHYSCGETLRVTLSRLAANLAIGAALCAAFDEGWSRCAWCHNGPPESDWLPGCGRPAPGWESRGEGGEG